MSNLIQVVGLSKSFGSKELFQDASVAINASEHVGVIGPNGAGKSTFFKILVGDLEADRGQIVRKSDLHIGYLGQEEKTIPDQTLEEFLEDAQCRLPLWELKKLSTGLGLGEQHFSMSLRQMSGGYRMRCKLLRLLGEQPDLMLLDEPTNYLDLESLLVLEQFLLNFKGAFLLISHDREFLKRTTDHIVEIEMTEITKYPGNIDDYFEQKALLQEQLLKKAQSVESKKKDILDFVNRFGAKATKAKQAQSRLKALSKLESVELKSLPVAVKIKLPEPLRTGKRILFCQGVKLGYGTKVVLEKVDLEIQNGNRVGVVGVNGAGKSTLLKALAKDLKPISGEINWGHEVDVGYFAQHVAEALDPHDTVFQALSKKAHPEVLPQEIKDLAGALLFSGQDIEKSISVLSGGEKSRVALGQILLKKAPCLLLDEPTNHLDFATVEALTQALNLYKGTVVVISHDRGFIGRIATKIIQIKDAKVEMYPGDYNEYLWSLENGILAKEDEAKNKSRSKGSKTGSIEKPNFKKQKKELESKIREIDRKFNQSAKKQNEITSQIEELNAKLMTLSGEEARKLVVEISKFQFDVIGLEEEQFELLEKKEQIENELTELLKGLN